MQLRGINAAVQSEFQAADFKAALAVAAGTGDISAGSGDAADVIAIVARGAELEQGPGMEVRAAAVRAADVEAVDRVISGVAGHGVEQLAVLVGIGQHLLDSGGDIRLVLHLLGFQGLHFGFELVDLLLQCGGARIG